MLWDLFCMYVKWVPFSQDCFLIIVNLHVLCEVFFIWELLHISLAQRKKSDILYSLAILLSPNK